MLQHAWILGGGKKKTGWVKEARPQKTSRKCKLKCPNAEQCSPETEKEKSRKREG